MKPCACSHIITLNSNVCTVILSIFSKYHLRYNELSSPLSYGLLVLNLYWNALHFLQSFRKFLNARYKFAIL